MDGPALITFTSLTRAFLDAVPELRPAVEARLREGWLKESSCHMVFGIAIAPEVISLLESGEQPETLGRVFAFVERMFSEGDEDVRWVGRISFLVVLHEHPRLVEKARRDMGERTLAISTDVERNGPQGSGV